MAKVDIKMPEGFLQSISMLGSDFDPEQPGICGWKRHKV